jgi:cysteine dioxygenase
MSAAPRPISPIADRRLGSADAGAASLYPKLADLIAYLDGLSARADLRILERKLTALDISLDDIHEACTYGVRGYRRNTISRGPWYELLALCWKSGHCTPIHDHQGVSCAFKVIQGLPTEIRFTPTPSGLIRPASSLDMPVGYVCAAEDADIHQVVNLQAPETTAVTLHIYSPPITKMNTYEFKTSAGGECGECYKN